MNKVVNVFFTLFFMVGCLAFNMPANADRVSINERISHNQKVPIRGAMMKDVEAKFGAPTKKMPAVGQPGISRWQYAAFTVYFENNRVLHSVVSH